MTVKDLSIKLSFFCALGIYASVILTCWDSALPDDFSLSKIIVIEGCVTALDLAIYGYITTIRDNS